MEEKPETRPLIVEAVAKEFSEHGALIHSLHMIDMGRRLMQMMSRHGATLEEVIEGITYGSAEQVMQGRFDFGLRQ